MAQGEAAGALLAQIEASPGVRVSLYYGWFLTEMVRIALNIGNATLAELFVAGFEPRHPYTQRALVAANAALTESRGDLHAAADAYADAADRWERFGVVPEQAFALLGQGRCLMGLDQASDAAPVLHHAREIFERLQAAPALAEVDALLQEGTALSS